MPGRATSASLPTSSAASSSSTTAPRSPRRCCRESIRGGAAVGRAATGAAGRAGGRSRPTGSRSGGSSRRRSPPSAATSRGRRRRSKSARRPSTASASRGRTGRRDRLSRDGTRRRALPAATCVEFAGKSDHGSRQAMTGFGGMTMISTISRRVATAVAAAAFGGGARNRRASPDRRRTRRRRPRRCSAQARPARRSPPSTKPIDAFWAASPLQFRVGAVRRFGRRLRQVRAARRQRPSSAGETVTVYLEPVGYGFVSAGGFTASRSRPSIEIRTPGGLILGKTDDFGEARLERAGEEPRGPCGGQRDAAATSSPATTSFC